jgi:hypothetical protein
MWLNYASLGARRPGTLSLLACWRGDVAVDGVRRVWSLVTRGTGQTAGFQGSR